MTTILKIYRDVLVTRMISFWKSLLKLFYALTVSPRDAKMAV